MFAEWKKASDEEKKAVDERLNTSAESSKTIDEDVETLDESIFTPGARKSLSAEGEPEKLKRLADECE